MVEDAGCFSLKASALTNTPDSIHSFTVEIAVSTYLGNPGVVPIHNVNDSTLIKATARGARCNLRNENPGVVLIRAKPRGQRLALYTQHQKSDVGMRSARQQPIAIARGSFKEQPSQMPEGYSIFPALR